ncbi:transposase [Streptomyces phaeochromogenes]
MLQATRLTLGLLAHRIGQLSEQIRDVDARLARLVECHAPQLLEAVGIGPDTAVALLISVGGNPERLGSEASFAAVRGVSPVERSSGRRQYRRLNRGGDRQANAALHRIGFTRLRVDPHTQDYDERRIKEGKTRREIVRGLKTYPHPASPPISYCRATNSGEPSTHRAGIEGTIHQAVAVTGMRRARHLARLDPSLTA